MTDYEISDKIFNGDHTAIKYLYQKYYIGLCSYAYRFTKNKTSAEEIVQQSILMLWEKRDSLQIKESIVAYLFRIVKNNCLNYLKHQQIVNRHDASLTQKLNQNEEFLALSQETGLSIYIAHELEDKINEAIEKLPEQCREIFKLSRFTGLKHIEIAHVKGITINTVQKQISIALGKLKTELTEYLPIVILLIIKVLAEIKKIS